jgi:hypothetical protein
MKWMLSIFFLNCFVVDPIVVKTVSNTSVSTENSKFFFDKRLFFLQDTKEPTNKTDKNK